MDHFADKLSKYKNVEQITLNLGSNNFSHIAGVKLGAAFYNLKRLRSINVNLYNNKLKQKGIEAIIKNISTL